MDTQELLKKVRKIEIKTRGISNHLFTGEYHSVFKGRGMSFSEVREYQFGDEIRTIDWNVTARFNSPYVKVFEEDRELIVMLMIDVSKSAFFGTNKEMKNDIITEISAILAFSAIHNDDKVGIIMFSNKVELYIPPKKGKQHILRIIRELVGFEPSESGTNIAEALSFMSNVNKKRSIVFCISDFIDDNYSDALKIAAKRHDVIGLKVYDKFESELQNIGLTRVFDAEGSEAIWVDTSSAAVRKKYNDWYSANHDYFKNAFLKSGSDVISVRTDEDYIKSLLGFFKNRGKRK